jgi:hypothetical protein
MKKASYNMELKFSGQGVPYSLPYLTHQAQLRWPRPEAEFFRVQLMDTNFTKTSASQFFRLKLRSQISG